MEIKEENGRKRSRRRMGDCNRGERSEMESRTLGTMTMAMGQSVGARTLLVLSVLHGGRLVKRMRVVTSSLER